MTVLAIQIASGDDDAYELKDNTGFSGTGTTTRFDDTLLDSTTYVGGLRFLNVTITQASTINTVSISGQRPSASADTPQVDVFCEDVDNAASYVTTADVVGRTKTSDSASFTGSNLGLTYAITGLAAPVQEVINRAGWASGNALNFLIQGKTQTNPNAEFGRWNSYETSSSAAPTVTIDYTPAVVPGGTAGWSGQDYVPRRRRDE